MFNTINKIKNHGYVPDYVFDIGACHGDWTAQCLSIFPNAKYFLFEPITYSNLDRFRYSDNINVYNELLFDSEKEVDFYEMRNSEDSIFKEKTYHFDNCIPIVKKTSILENIVDTSNFHNIFMKIDTQGAELPILNGCKSFLSKIDFLLLEIPFFGQYNSGVPNFMEHINKLDELGFIVYDIADKHDVLGFIMSVDFVFINKNHPISKLPTELLEKR